MPPDASGMGPNGDLHRRALDLEARNAGLMPVDLYRLISEMACRIDDIEHTCRLGRPMRNEVCVPTPDDDAAVIAAAFELLAGCPKPGLRITHTPDGRQRIRAVTSSGTVLTPLELLKNLVRHHQGRAERYKQFALHGVIPKPEDIDHIESMEP